MPRFDLSKYATVAERLAMVESEFPDFRIETVDYSTDADRAKGVWRVEARLYLTKEDQVIQAPKAVGHAFEVDGQPGANTTSALENAETSAVGRCLALASTRWSGNKDDASKSLASREEMEKAARGKPQVTNAPEVPKDFFERVRSCDTLDALQELWESAKVGGYADFVREAITKRKKELEGGQSA
jgi:hypothetical protein